MNFRFLFLGLLLLPLFACPKAPVVPEAGAKACTAECEGADKLLAAAKGFSNVAHDFVLDPTSSLAPGRGIEKREGGAYAITPIECAEPKARGGAVLDAQKVDFAYVGVAVDGALVSADASIAPFLSAGGEASSHTIRLVAVAFVHDADPQFFKPGSSLSSEGDHCGCGRATHFVGAVKHGGMLSYEVTVRAAEVRGSGFDLFRARLAAKDGSIRQTSVGDLRVDGLEALTEGKASHEPLRFHVNNPVPIAYAIYPISDVCKFSFPAPEVTPSPVDFGLVPTGAEGTRLVHVQNRGNIDLHAYYGDQALSLPAEGAVDIPLRWRADGEPTACEERTREETLSFVPANSTLVVTPRQQTVRIVERMQSGRGKLEIKKHIDSGEGRKPDYASTDQKLVCPPDYVRSECSIEHAECGDGKACTVGGYSVSAEPTADGCRVRCQGPTSLLPGVISGANYCRFDAVLGCQLRCGAKPAP